MIRSRARNQAEHALRRALALAPQRAAAPLARELGARRRRELRRRLAEIDIWFHALDLGGGIVTGPAVKGTDQLHAELERLCLPDLRGRTLLDIGAWDGYFTFATERAGARVTAFDRYAWAVDWGAYQRHAHARIAEGRSVEAAHDLPGVWRPRELPGKRGFDLAHRALRSGARPVVGDLMRADPRRLGRHDVVLYLGVLYHITDPFGALRRLARVTGGLAVIETEAISLPPPDARPLCEFFPADELAGDATNWWAPNLAALHGLCRAAGFRGVETVVGPPPRAPGDEELVRYRCVVHAIR